MHGFAQGVYIAGLELRGMLTNIMLSKLSDGDSIERPSPFGEGFSFTFSKFYKKRERAIDIALASRLCDHSKLKIYGNKVDGRVR